MSNTSANQVPESPELASDRCNRLADAITETAVRCGLHAPGTRLPWAGLFMALDDIASLLVMLQQSAGLRGSVCGECQGTGAVITRFHGVGPCPACSHR